MQNGYLMHNIRMEMKCMILYNTWGSVYRMWNKDHYLNSLIKLLVNFSHFYADWKSFQVFKIAKFECKCINTLWPMGNVHPVVTSLRQIIFLNKFHYTNRRSYTLTSHLSYTCIMCFIFVSDLIAKNKACKKSLLKFLHRMSCKKEIVNNMIHSKWWLAI